MRLVPQLSDVPMTLGWTLATTVGMWAGTLMAEELRHGWQLDRLAHLLSVALIGLTISLNYLHVRR